MDEFTIDEPTLAEYDIQILHTLSEAKKTRQSWFDFNREEFANSIIWYSLLRNGQLWYKLAIMDKGGKADIEWTNYPQERDTEILAILQPFLNWLDKRRIKSALFLTVDLLGEKILKSSQDEYRKLEEDFDNTTLNNVFSMILYALKNGSNSYARQLENGSIIHWDLYTEDLRPHHNKIILNARYYLQRHGEAKYQKRAYTPFTGIIEFSALQLTGSEQDCGHVKLTGECHSESDFIRERFDSVWYETVQALKTQAIDVKQADAGKPPLQIAEVNAEIQIKNKFADMWINRGWVRMKGYNMTQWLQENNVPVWLTDKELQRHIATTRKNQKAGKYYKPKL